MNTAPARWASLIALTAALCACDPATDSGGESPDDMGDSFDGGLLLDLGGGEDPADEGVIDDAEAPDGLPVIDAEVRLDGGQGGADAMPPPLPAECLDPPPPPEQPAIDMAPRCRQGGGPLRIRDLRDARCPDYIDFVDRNDDGFSDTREDVTLPEAVVTAIFEDAFAVQDPEGGPWSGLWVFLNRDPIPRGLEVGSRVRLTGSFFEFFTLTEMTPEEVEIIGDGPAPEPILVADPRRVADGGDLIEPLENVLIEVRNASVLLTEPDCPRDFDMFIINGGLRVEDEVGLDYEPSRADFLLSAVGVLHFSFDHMKIRPRAAGDLEVVHCGGIPDKCEAAECAAEVGAPESRALIITEIMDDPRGPDADREWLELYNPGPGDLNLDGWRLETCPGVRAELSGRIRAGQRLVVAARLDERDNGGVEADLLLGELSLSNGEGSLLVFDADEVLVDQVRYSTEAPWPLRDSGQSLELLAPAADNSNGAAWQSGQQNYGEGGRGTPGR